MGITLSKVRIENYKSIRNMLINLEETNVIFGKNNTGKTNILKAIHLAMTSEYISNDDVFHSVNEPFNIGKRVLIDLCFMPTDNEGAICSEFDEEWALIIGDSISIDSDNQEFFSYRTEMAFDETRSLFSNIKKRIKVWNDDGSSVLDLKFNYRIFDFMQCYYVDANRDISVDLKDRKSIWSKLVSKVKIPEEKKMLIQQQLSDINESIKNESELLRHIELELQKSVSEEEYSIDVSPVTKDVESLYKGIDIYYSSQHFDSIPVTNLGSGIRSWAVFSSIKSQIDLAHRITNSFYSIILVEEPEAHIHPQSQMKVANILKGTCSQKIIVSHSPHIIGSFNLSNLKRADKDKNGTVLFSFGKIISDKNKVEKIFITNKNDFLFSKLTIFVEGYTEMMVMPLYFKNYFNKMPFELGVSFVSYDGGGVYRPFLELATAFSLNWIIFSDGEKPILNGLKNSIREVFNNPILELKEEKRIMYFPNGENYESYLYNNGFKHQIHKIIDKLEREHKFIFNKFTHDQKWKDKKKDKTFSTQSEEIDAATLFYLSKEKIILARDVANEILKSFYRDQDIPVMIINLMKKIEKILGDQK